MKVEINKERGEVRIWIRGMDVIVTLDAVLLLPIHDRRLCLEHARDDVGALRASTHELPK